MVQNVIDLTQAICVNKYFNSKDRQRTFSLTYHSRTIKIIKVINLYLFKITVAWSNCFKFNSSTITSICTK